MKKVACLMLLMVVIGCGQQASTESASAPTAAASGETTEAELLFVQEAESVTFEGDTLTLVGVRPQVLFFTDRPQRVAGYLAFDEFLAEVSAGTDSFADDPPNATLVVLEGDEFEDVVLELVEEPVLTNGNLAFKVNIIEGLPPDTAGRSALFIDTIGRPMSPGSVAGAHRRHRRREVRRHTP
jgi:hypothetical protein